jgi:hypothetical protein
MTRLVIELADDRRTYRPGDTARGVIRWQWEEEPEAVELRLFWHTRGKGTQDVGIVDTLRVDAPGVDGGREFGMRLPGAPYSFSGKLISLIWSLELVVLPSKDSERVEITVAPEGKEIVLPNAATADNSESK